MSFNFNFQEIFPTKWSFIIFILYSTLFVNQVAGLYFVPASLYVFYNYLTYINLSTFDPTTYYMVLQLRVVVTGVIFQFIFKKELSFKQWISLILLTFGCMLKQVNFGDMPASDTVHDTVMNKELGASFSLGTLLLVIQVFCSCLGGVYNEYLLKHHANDVNIYLQNIFNYVDSIICIFILLIFQGKILEIVSYDSIQPLMNYGVMLVVFNNAVIGIVTSFFLRYLNSVLKTFASAVELVFTMVLSRLMFSIPIYLNTLVSVAIVITATIIYGLYPVVNYKPVKKDEPSKQQSQC